MELFPQFVLCICLSAKFHQFVFFCIEYIYLFIYFLLCDILMYCMLYDISRLRYCLEAEAESSASASSSLRIAVATSSSDTTSGGTKRTTYRYVYRCIRCIRCIICIDV
jgi:hypothetical protein